MSDWTYEPHEAVTHVANLGDFKTQLGSQVSDKVSESPNILVYGVMCMGVVGWWMQLAQHDAQRLVRSSGLAIDYCKKGMEDVIEIYRVTEEGHAQAAERIGQIADEIDGL